MMNTNMYKKITLKENKTLKLKNVLSRELTQSEFMNENKIMYMMESYIKSKCNSIVGPMINYSSIISGENGQPKLVAKLMVQLKETIENLEEPYEFSSQIRVPNCLFARFIEKEQNLQFAYAKLNLHAFENNIKLLGDNYTIFVERNKNNIVADIFMQMQNEVGPIENI
ncbi:hypothetical protein P7C31_03335 [Clostridium perfringens]|uniref:hypothetical protein n=1 Tax=Clostridium perfringens TaxID=1502 RepID=UPI00240D2CB5|nr:hypothetical protein [Clostridium perfringens]WFD85554.1 hypothetical protein P7C31_03335 [Clostridium perfringens]WFD98369.1 hypothetical protein P7D00_03335 [Clostridium perfringens]